MSKLGEDGILDQEDTAASSLPDTMQTDMFAALVGEGKRYATPADLAKAKIEADTFIEQLKRENAEARAIVSEQQDKLKKAKGIEDAIADVTASRRTTTETTGAVDEKVIDARIAAHDQKKKLTDNLTKSEDALISKHNGDTVSAKKALQVRASELGATVKELLTTAAKNPAMFSELMGIKKEAGPIGVSRPDGDVDASAEAQHGSDNPEMGTQNYYAKLRRENPSLYLSPKIQAQMVKDAETKGKAFYNNP